MRPFFGVRLLPALALLVVLGVARGVGAADEEEPVYGGERLSEWVAGLSSSDSQHSEATRIALRKVDLKELPSLLGALKSKNVTFRFNAAIVLGAIGPKASQAMKALVPLLKDNDVQVRMTAATALGQIGAKFERDQEQQKGTA